MFRAAGADWPARARRPFPLAGRGPAHRALALPSGESEKWSRAAVALVLPDATHIRGENLAVARAPEKRSCGLSCAKWDIAAGVESEGR